MHVIFGQDLTACPLPKSLHGINRIVLGPRGLIDFLELRLGLPPVVIDHTTRLLAYREALRNATEQSGRFYSASFQVDPFGSSKILLRWRDDLCLNGWNPTQSHSEASLRLQDLAEVDQIFRKTGNDDQGDSHRLSRIQQILSTGGNPKIDQIDLLETLDHFPLRWRAVLALLKVTENALPTPNVPIARVGTRLHTMQARLLGSDAPCDDAKDDESIRIVEDQVLSKNADAAAALLAKLSRDPKLHSSTTQPLHSFSPPVTGLICDQSELESLDRAVRNLDTPSVGSGFRSSLGALVQLAPVIVRLHWGPFNPQAWLEFFLHPVRPLSAKLAGNLAFAINQAPSRVNPAWNQAIENTLKSTPDPIQQKRLKKQIKLWLYPEEFAAEARTAVLAESMLRLSLWLGKRGALRESEKEQSMWLAAASAIKSLAKSIASVPHVSREDLERIFAEWLPTASTGENRGAELGGSKRLGSVGHLLSPIDHLVWWQPREGSVVRHPWTRKEIAWLSGAGVDFPDPDLLAKTNQARAYRSVLYTRKSLTLFHCPQSEASASMLSPFAVRLSAEFGNAILKPSEELIETDNVKIHPLPPHRDHWQISCPELLTHRENESFSSLSKFIYSPWEWVLNYKARLRFGPQVDFRIVDDARRQGSLLHGFVESLLEPEPDPFDIKDNNLPSAGKSDEASAGLLDTLVRRLFDEGATITWKDISQDAVNEWVQSNWFEILKLQAAHYLVPGNEASRSELLYLAKNAIWELLLQLKAAQITAVTCEEKILDVPFCGGLLGGFIDLKVTNQEGKIGLIDLKLGGLSYRREELIKGRHLQLAIYGHLVQARHGQDAHCAYFIFSGGGKMLARTNQFFPRADIVFNRGENNEDEWRSCWEGFEKLWKIRRGQLNAGRLELDNSLDLGLWAVPDPGKYSDYRNLAGWAKTD